MIKYRVFVIILSFLLLLPTCGCGNNKDEKLSEVDMKKDLSVLITYRQISYKGIISFKNGTLYVTLSDNGNVLDGVSYEVNSTEIKYCYDNMTKSFSHNSFPDTFVPKILYEFFCRCGDVFFTEKVVTDEYTFIERNVCGIDVQFRVYESNTGAPYSIIIK